MIDSILISRGVENKASRNKVKFLIALFTVVLAVASPFIAHVAFGAASGVRWLPMYYPVLLAGLLLGPIFGLAVGVTSPLISFILTSIMGSPMPALVRLPFMMVELLVFGAVSGSFSSFVSKRSYLAFPVVLLSELLGRGVFLGLVALFNSLTPLTPSLIWSQILMGWPGLLFALIVVPSVVMVISHFAYKREN